MAGDSADSLRETGTEVGNLALKIRVVGMVQDNGGPCLFAAERQPHFGHQRDVQKLLRAIRYGVDDMRDKLPGDRNAVGLGKKCEGRGKQGFVKHGYLDFIGAGLWLLDSDRRGNTRRGTFA